MDPDEAFRAFLARSVRWRDRGPLDDVKQPEGIYRHYVAPLPGTTPGAPNQPDPYSTALVVYLTKQHGYKPEEAKALLDYYHANPTAMDNIDPRVKRDALMAVPDNGYTYEPYQSGNGMNGPTFPIARPAEGGEHKRHFTGASTYTPAPVISHADTHAAVMAQGRAMGLDDQMSRAYASRVLTSHDEPSRQLRATAIKQFHVFP